MLVNNGTAERFQQRFTFRSIQEIARGWRGLTDIAQSAFSNRIDPQLPFEDEKKVASFIKRGLEEEEFTVDCPSVSEILRGVTFLYADKLTLLA